MQYSRLRKLLFVLTRLGEGTPGLIPDRLNVFMFGNCFAPERLPRSISEYINKTA